MKRKEFIQTMGVGIFGLCATGLNGCSKEKNDKLIVPSKEMRDNDITDQFTPGNSTVVDGYTDKLSYLPNEIVRLYINANKRQNVKIGIYTPSGTLKGFIDVSLNEQVIGPEPYMNGFGYSISYEYLIPDEFPSGLYYFARKIPFIVKNAKKMDRL